MGNNVLFDLINALFTDKSVINGATPECANQNMFMVNRRMAIHYPLQSDVFNIPKINNLDLLKFWSDFLYCGKVPKWVYISTSKKKGVDKTETEEKISDSLLKKYCERYKVCMKDVKSALRFNENAREELKDFEKMMKEIEDSYKASEKVNN